MTDDVTVELMVEVAVVAVSVAVELIVDVAVVDAVVSTVDDAVDDAVDSTTQQARQDHHEGPDSDVSPGSQPVAHALNVASEKAKPRMHSEALARQRRIVYEFQ